MAESDEKEKERKAGATLPWGAVGSESGLNLGGSWIGNGASALRAAKVGAGFARGGSVFGNLAGLPANLAANFAAIGKAGMLATAVLGAGAATYGVYDMGRRGGFGTEPVGRPGIFFGRERTAPVADNGMSFPGGDASSLDLARVANQGVFGEPGEDSEADAMAESDESAGEGFGEEGGEYPDGYSAGPPDGAIPSGVGVPDGAADAAEKAAEEMLAGAGEKGGLSSKLGGLDGSAAGGGAQTSASLSAGGPKSGPDSKGADAGKLEGLSQGRTGRVVRAKRPMRNKGGTLALKSQSGKRLAQMQGLMSSAQPNPETAAATNTGAWEAQQPSGQAISGPGTGSGGIESGGAGTDGAGLGNGGPVDGGQSGNYGGGPGPGDPPDPGPIENVTPYQMMVDLAILLLGIASLIMLLIGIFGKSLFGAAVAAMLIKLVIGIGVIVALLGVGIMAFGQTLQGGFFTAMGSMTAVFAFMALGDSGAQFEFTKQTTAFALASAVSGLLGAGGGVLLRSGAVDGGGVGEGDPGGGSGGPSGGQLHNSVPDQG